MKIQETIEFHHFSPRTPTSSSNQNSQDRRQQEAEMEEEVFDELTKILFECLEQVEATQKGFLLRKIFNEIEKESQLEKFIVERLNHSQVKAISELLQRCQEVDYDKQEIVQRGLDDNLMEGCYFHRQPACKLERFKVKSVNPVQTAVIKK